MSLHYGGTVGQAGGCPLALRSDGRGRGIGYVICYPRPCLYPDAEIGFVFAAFFGELVFLVWLATLGWRIPNRSRRRPGQPQRRARRPCARRAVTSDGANLKPSGYCLTAGFGSS